MKMNNTLLWLFIIAIMLYMSACFRKPTNRTWFDCETVIDTTLVAEDWDHGAYLIDDSLILTTGCHPFDTNFCNTINLRIEPIISFHGKHVCSLADLYPPFEIYKPRASDTLVVIKNGKTIFFQIPDHLCKRRYETK